MKMKEFDPGGGVPGASLRSANDNVWIKCLSVTCAQFPHLDCIGRPAQKLKRGAFELGLKMVPTHCQTIPFIGRNLEVDAESKSA